MKCITCHKSTKVNHTQSNESLIHRPPQTYKNLRIVRRKRICLADKTHTFWTIELTEDFWLDIINQIDLVKLEEK